MTKKCIFRPVWYEVRGKKCVIFIDELPCLDITGTRFVSALSNFWNSFVSRHENMMLVVCGSATTWMIKNIVDNHGGLHNRITHEMHIHPFTLKETETYFQSRGFVWDRLSLTQLYMAIGGIPYYMSLVKDGESVSQAIDRLFFSQDGELRKEYDRLFKSLFANPEPYVEIINALANCSKGLTRQEISDGLGKSNGGRLSEQLDNLMKCDFIRLYNIKTKRICKSGGIYQLTDFYIRFYNTFIKKNITTDEHYWSTHLLSPKVNNWYELAFERVCLSHIEQIKKALGVERIASEYYSWREKGIETGAQIDLVIERADRTINLCEIKYSDAPYAIDKDEDLKLRMRRQVFVEQTSTSYGIAQTMITTFGLTKNAYSGGVLAEVLLDDLFA